MKKYSVITLCGSTRFKDEFEDLQKKLTLQGYIVISVGMFGHAGDSEVWEGQEEGTYTNIKRMLDDMHKSKIDMADEIFVVNPDGYIGRSTCSEICYARMLGKPIRSLEDIDISKIDLKIKEHIARAEELAWKQLDGARHTYGYVYDENEDVGFFYKRQLVLDPWISEKAHTHGSPWADHQNPEEAVEPFSYYGKKRMARFVETIVLERGEDELFQI